MRSFKPLFVPFFFVSVLAIALIAVIVFTRTQADKSINQLQKGSREAMRVFSGKQLLDEVINAIYIADSRERYSNEKNASTFTDSLSTIVTQSQSLDRLFAGTEVESKTSRFTELVQRQVGHLKKDTGSSSARPAAAVQLSDSIFIAALELEEAFGQHLQTNITGNELLAAKVLKLDLVLTVLIIFTIAALATIILWYLFRNMRLLAALQNQRLEIEKAARIKQQFLANMSHEIRTPINSVIGFTNLLQNTQLDQKQQLFVEVINKANNNLLSIVNDILDISKIEAGMLRFDKAPFSIRDACYQVETLLFQQAVEKKLYLETTVAGSIPDLVMGDKERLIQILINLTTNAIKFTESGGVQVSVKADPQPGTNNRILFSVKDTGIGIKPDKLTEIFNRFEQADAETGRKYGGTGLGLTIVKDLIEMQGGQIAVISEDGKGSDFFFEIEYEPCLQPEIDLVAAEIKSAPQQADSFVSDAGIRVLAAEDNTMNQLLLRMLFEQWQVAIDIVHNGEAALEKLRQQAYQLVLVDIQMPGMDGYQVVHKIRAELAMQVPVIAMTANVLPGEKEKCLAAGMNGYISKPINEVELHSLVVLHTNNSIAGGGHQQFVNAAYLNRVYGANKDNIADILQQFQKQFREEMEKLDRCVADKNTAGIKVLAHHMRTTVSAVNNLSPLLARLQVMENADESASGWNIVIYNYRMLQLQQPVVEEQVNEMLLFNT
jgi:signal transduction histidine kinase/DNA-binding response OmpR family regulator